MSAPVPSAGTPLLAVLAVLAAPVFTLLGLLLGKVLDRRAARAQADEAAEARAREDEAKHREEEARRLAEEAQRLYDALLSEVSRLRGRVDVLEQRLEQMQADLTAARERASRHRIATAELVAAARSCPAHRKDCPVLARFAALTEPEAQED